jgi:4-hydroxybenzoate polyprenyltransferase
MSVDLLHPAPQSAGAAFQSQIANRQSQITAFASDIKIHHTVFALPFALLSTFMAAGGWPGAGKLLLILACMVSARTLAMAMNRLLDAKLDAINPRTARRAIPSGTLSAKFFAAAIVLCMAAFIAATALFWPLYHNPWPLIFSVPVLLFLSGYPLLKRFTRLCHYYLGAALGLAPVCAWVAVKGNLQLPPVLMAAAVLCWTAGFDIIYACQDYRIDVECGLFSVPAKIGIGPALWVARLTHAVSVLMLMLLGFSTASLGPLYFVGVGVAVLLLIVEHAMVKPNDLSKVNLAFFTMNGIISLLLGTLGIIDVFIRGGR